MATFFIPPRFREARTCNLCYLALGTSGLLVKASPSLRLLQSGNFVRTDIFPSVGGVWVKRAEIIRFVLFFCRLRT